MVHQKEPITLQSTEALGGYAVKNDKLKLLHTEAINVITSHSLKVVSYNWIPREKNIVADLLSIMVIKQEKDFSYISLPIKDQKKWYNKAAADPMKHVARFRASVTNSFKIKNLDGSTKLQPGDRIDVTWHSDVEDRKYTDISIKLMDAESLSIYELAFPRASPQTPDYCLVNEKYTHTKKPSIDLNVLWSVVILRQREGTCGSGLWDFEMDVIESELTNYQTPVPKPGKSQFRNK
ncbi:hypothetical protein BCR33DRAFT_741365 [Rhizoclosmatium globosum]|uniref:Uncharacterized protein n=1 Tax=Rhizoclosmatium globosum TaxID=329046 RepID=A0A1Y2BVT6_9FUNG|nr:hypothetical protein BCR33DRAFT_741365 [Rhizoclosmatium globosum]|eukprot:ORY38882.1 hypothetical protein BCR33DRAFT_741365 [Rhizoclosmatium globosum]